MRDLLLTMLVFGLLPYVLMRPHVGILLWSWLGYMNPHRLSYGFAYSFPFAQLVAIALILALVFSKEPKRLPITPVTVVWLLFLFWMCISTVFALYPEDAQLQLIKVLKIQLIAFLTMMIMTTKERLNMLVWVIFLSIGFFGIKGGIFTILSGGSYRVWGPPGSYIEGNNELALATLMVVPLAFYLRKTVENKWLKLILLGCMVLMVISSIGSQSRGALLAALALGFYMWMKSSSKIITGVAAVSVGIALFSFMPQNWHDRMSTIETYEEDRSALGRINAWTMATNMSLHRLTGGGYEIWRAEIFAVHSPEPEYIHDAHSIYFEVLGEQGIPGLGLFLLLWFLGFRTGNWIVKKTKGIDELASLGDLAKMLQVSMIAYAVGGAFLGLAYFDLPYHLLGIMVICKVIVQKHLDETSSKIK